MPPPVDVDAIARGLGPQGPVLLNKMVHGLLDAFIPIFLLLCPPRAWRQQLSLRFNLPHCGQCGVTAALRLFTLETKGRGRVRSLGGWSHVRGLVGARWGQRSGTSRGYGCSAAQRWAPGMTVRCGEGGSREQGHKGRAGGVGGGRRAA